MKYLAKIGLKAENFCKKTSIRYFLIFTDIRGFSTTYPQDWT